MTRTQLCALAGLAVAAAPTVPAFAQYTVLNATGNAYVSGPGGTVQNTSNDPQGFILDKTNAHAAASAQFVRYPGELSIYATGSAQPQGPDSYMGTGTATIRFTTAQSYYVQVNLVADPGSCNNCFAEAYFKNAITQIPINSSGVVPAGEYLVSTTASSSDGDVNSQVNLQFSQSNTLCAQAITVTDGLYPGTTLGAISTGGATATCGSSANSPSVWYRYVATRTGATNISTCGSSYDTVLSVYSSNSCPTLGQQIACNDDAGGPQCSATDSRVSVNTTQGSVYYIRVSGYLGASGNYLLHIGPDNDSCGFAYQIPNFPFTADLPFDNTGANTDGPAVPGCTNGGIDPQINGDLWYTYTPIANGTLTLDTCTGGANFDTKLAAYAGLPCSPNAAYITCSDDSCGPAPARLSSVTFPVLQGHDYFVRVGGYLTARGSGVLHAAFVPDPMPCDGDFNNDNFLDFFDVDAFVQCFEGGECPPGKTADFNHDDFVDFFDMDAFLEAYTTGC